jgi:hypothetical protein
MTHPHDPILVHGFFNKSQIYKIESHNKNISNIYLYILDLFYYTVKGDLLMVTRHITKIGVFSLGKVFGTIYAIMGLIFGAIISLMSMGMGSLMGNEGAFAGILFGAGSIIVLPIFYGILGFIGGIIIALVYNAASGFIGGLEVEVE